MVESIGVAIGYDIDNTLVRREWPTSLAEALRGGIGYSFPKYPWNTPFAIPDLNHEPVDTQGIKRVALWFHQRRRAIPGVAERLKKEASQGVELYAISGRPATTEWLNATINQFEREGIPIPGTRIILTPTGVSTRVSKAHAIRELNIEEYSDDDLRTILYLSRSFPDRKFNWISHNLAGIFVPKAIPGYWPNIKIVPINEWTRNPMT